MEVTPVETQGLKDREAANVGQHRRPIVALGAEQGGLRPVQQFLAEMPSDCGMAFVVILRQPDGSVADLVASLQRQSSLTLIQVDARTPVELDHVYVVPPDHQVVMEDGTIDVVERARPEHEVAPIDLLFRTLAEAHGPDTAAVVLSGTGADGAMGLQRIKEMGGLTLAQDPADAEVSEMPRHAVATGMVDVILPAAELPAKLIDYWQRADVVRIPHEEIAEPLDEDVLQELFALVRLRTGHDFSQYKRSTILRRLGRRMQVTHADTMAAYIALLRGSLDETRALLRDFLISVTNFFRDREAWGALETIVPPLFSGKTAEDQVRVWVTGCATGEEAYSVAILLHEYAATLDEPPTIQVFATVIDDDAIAVARQGRYSETIAVDVEPARLRRYFVAEPGYFRVRQELRDLVLFASHNILRDPPFSRLDLVTCRNVLIYLNRAVQDQVLRLFHFGMLPDGYLLLGSSESTEGVPDLFAPVDRSLRLFQRRAVLTSSPLVMSDQPVARTRRPPSAPPDRNVDGQRPSLATLHERLLLDHLPPSILVTGDFDIVHVAAGAGQFLQFAEGEPSHNLLEVAIPELRLELRTAFFAAQQDGGDKITRRIPIKHDGRELIEIVVRPIQEPAWAEGFYLIVFREIAEISEIVRPAGDHVEPMVRQIEDELQRTQDQLRLTVEQYETAVEEYRAANEELQAINEEARATSEELETSKEELQSANEELTTLNQALKHSLEESQQTSNDLHNLITATQIGTIFLDRDLRIKLFTPAAQSLFNLIPADIYRPLHHITHQLIYDELTQDAERVRATPEPVQREVASVDGRWYLARLLPYRTGDGTVTGIVLTFVDITERKRDEMELRERAELLTLAQRVAGAGVWSVNPDTGATFISDECRVLIGFQGRPDVSGLNQWIDEVCHPDDRDRLRQARDAASGGERDLDLEFRVLLEEHGERWILLRSRRMVDSDEHINN